MELAGIDQLLKDGCRLHAFCSGGGLRVVRIEKDSKLKGYGEHPQVEDALSHANEDYLAGGRPYKKVYGGTKPYYLTGSSTSTSPLDQWLLQGHTFDAWQNGEGVVFQLKGLTDVKIPKEVRDSVMKSEQSATWKHRGYTYLSEPSWIIGELGIHTKIIKSPKGKRSGSDPWMYRIAKTGYGKNFIEAMENAFEAEEVEVRE